MLHCSFNSVAVSLWTDRSSELPLTHRRESGWEDDTLLVRQVCLSVLYLAWCCISSATRRWSAQSHSQLEVCFIKDRKSTWRMSCSMLGGRAVRFQIISKSRWKIHEARNSHEFWALHEYCLFEHMELNHFWGTAVYFFPRKGTIPFLIMSFGTCRLLFSPGKDPEIF